MGYRYILVVYTGNYIPISYHIPILPYTHLYEITKGADFLGPSPGAPLQGADPTVMDYAGFNAAWWAKVPKKCDSELRL